MRTKQKGFSLNRRSAFLLGGGLLSAVALSAWSSAAHASVVHFDFSEGSGNYITESNSGAVGVLAPVGGGTFTGTGGGKFGGALVFDPPTDKEWSGALNFGQFTSNFDVGSAGTVTFFVNHDRGGYRQAYLDLGGQIRAETHSSFRPYSSIGGSDTYNGSNPTVPVDGEWHQIAVTWDTTGHTIYMDGVEVRTTNAALTVNTLNEIVRIGRRNTEGDTSNHVVRSMDGAIDDLAFYDARLSQSQISAINTNGVQAEITNNGLNPVAYWNFDDAPGTTKAASQVGGIDMLVGDPQGFGVTFAAGPTLSGSGDTLGALYFDGVNELSRVVIEDAPALDFDKTAGTIAFWTKIDEEGRRHTFLKTADESISIQLDSNGRLFASANDDNDTSGNLSSGTLRTDFFLTEDEWTHIAFAWDATTGAQFLFVNGELLTTGTYHNGPVNVPWTVPDTSAWVLGNDPIVSSRKLQGYLADFAAFDRVLTEDELRQIVGYGAASLASTTPPVPEPATAALGLMGLAGLAMAARRRRMA